MSGGPVVVGVGNRLRRDDRAGLEVIARLRGRTPDGVELIALEGGPTPLLELLATSRPVLLIDAVASDEEAGTVYRFDATRAALPGGVFASSTHAFGLGETIELARTLGRLGGQVFVYGIAGADFGAGEGLSASVEAAVETTARRVLDDLAQLSATER